MRAHLDLSEQEMLGFLTRHQLPSAFRATAEEFFLPLARTLPERQPQTGPLFLGINGAQGTGKSTLADFLLLVTASLFNWNVAVLSIDDFYKTRAERAALAKDVHPLLATRGVPGTHDIDMLARYLDRLQQAEERTTISLPRFDKSVDDRAQPSACPVVQGPIDLVILEGWCVGSQSQPDAALEAPINTLERNEDKDGVWRRYANDQLRTRYASVFARLDTVVFLKAPGFDAIFRWRLEQEEKLAAKTKSDSVGLMNKDQVTRFIQHYERITRSNLETLSGTAHIVFELDESHSVTASRSTLLS